MSNRKIGIVGSGLIGRSWAMLFASVGYEVVIYDIDPKQVETALIDVEKQLKSLEDNGLLRGKFNAQQQFAFITGTTTLVDAVKDSTLVQECVPENLALKQQVWKDVDDVAGADTIFSTSTSTFLPSAISDHLVHRSNFVVSHPVNPPYYVPLTEVVPAPWTDAAVARRTRDIMDEIGQTPVSLRKEVPGFAVNRLQYALLNETWNLVNEGVLDVCDIDKVMSDGLGMRYAFLGPLETAHLNADGFVNYCERYANTIHAVCEDFKPLPKFQGPLVETIAKQLESQVPLDKLQERRNWRDLALTKLSQLKKQLQ